MIHAHLFVRYQFDKSEDGKPRTENWGRYGFLAQPRVGEAIEAYHDHDFHTVVVSAIDHTALEQPIAHPELQSWHSEPSIRLIADWRSCD